MVVLNPVSEDYPGNSYVFFVCSFMTFNLASVISEVWAGIVSLGFIVFAFSVYELSLIKEYKFGV